MLQTESTFNAIRISLASPEQIRAWSYGEVVKPETINYRTLRPERDGLFCERIFGPTKDWECACGKYKKMRFKGIKCERCGVEVTRAKVRRERMGHIELAAPVAHIWLSKGVPSRLGLLLDLSPRNLERVLYFAQYIIIAVDEKTRQSAIEAVEREYQETREKRLGLSPGSKAKTEGASAKEPTAASPQMEASDAADPEAAFQSEQAQLEEEYQARIDELHELRPGQLLVETRYRELRERYAGVFQADMGAEAVLELLRGLNLEEQREMLAQEMRSATGQRRRKAIKRLRVVEAFRKGGNRPEWMVLAVLPVLPPDLRPMVQLDGGRFATSDLNDLYRRVINRNNRLRRLLDLEAPEIIIRNEKRMLQEAVDALIDNGRHGRAIAGSHNHKLKSLSDLLRGKQGRFRQNLLGKRVDYSGRSVIVVGPELQLHQCGLPKRMALELFKPFVMHRLVVKGIAHNIKTAKRAVERVRPEVWDVLEEVIQDRPVLLNRAPTLHRLGIQAFMPVLIEGSAIQLHPLVCTAFNADFDGDQMAVHVPISLKAVQEAKRVMLSTYNMLSPASGEPLVTPTLDIVLGCYYLTMEGPGVLGVERRFVSFEEARLAQFHGFVSLQAPIQVLQQHGVRNGSPWLTTTVGRLVFQEVLPPALAADPANWNKLMDKAALKELTARSIRELGNQTTAQLLDQVKTLGFHYATVSGITIAINDLEVPHEKHEIVGRAEGRIQELEELYQRGLISSRERYDQTLNVWSEASEAVTHIIEEKLPTFGGTYLMAASGTKGNISQISQMVGMRGLMSDPKGRLIDVPVTSSFREGLSVLEYFISTHGARKGLADTALRTADSGYLTRRMVDVAQELIALSPDCGTTEGSWIRHEEEKERRNFIAPFVERIATRFTAAPVADPKTGEILLAQGALIDEDAARRIWDAGVREVYVRSVLTCEAKRGICVACYGVMPATGRLIAIGEAAGIIASQSIGEPGTQLTMRTFHTGGVAGVDITSGIPRVEELFEARIPKSHAILSEIDGTVDVDEGPDGKRIRVLSLEEYREEYPLPPGYRVQVRGGEKVETGTPLALPRPGKKASKDSQPPAAITAHVAGRVELADGKVAVVWQEQEERLYPVAPTVHVLVKSGEKVIAGQELTAGQRNPHDILRIRGKEAVQQYIMEETQKVYRTQGVTINDKHVEMIIRQILRKVRVDLPGDTELLPGEPVDRFTFDEINRKVLAEGGEPARATPLLLGITRTSLSTDSFLAAASFQETTRVLTEAAINGMVDNLQGLKENVIIGRLVPARIDLTEEGRKRLGLDELVPVAMALQDEAPVSQEALSLLEEESSLSMLGITGAEPEVGEQAAEVVAARQEK
jgi:DNA-directed RNA polymerase subunit beta'